MGVGLNIVGPADSGDLFEVVLAVDKLKLAPLIDAERAENHVAGASDSSAKEFLCFGAEVIHMRKVLGHSLGKLFSGKPTRCGSGRN